MINNFFSVITNPTVVCLTLFVLWILTIEKKKKVQYFLEARLANQHTINNLLVNSMSINSMELQTSYLRFVAKYVNYGFSCQDQSHVSLQTEIDQVYNILRGYEISNETEYETLIDIGSKEMLLPIVPFSVITIVENAIIHGDLEKSGNKLVMAVELISDSLFMLKFSGYKIPDEQKLNNPKKGHGLFILKERLKFIHSDKNTTSVKRNRFIFLNEDGSCLQMILPK